MMRLRYLIICLLLMSGAVNTWAQQTVRLDGNSQGKMFEGIGVVNGGGATAVLLKDYPEPQRSQIMELVYRPMFGGSVSSILVEIPGDGNSTQGSMPAHSHFRGDNNPRRGYMWWVMQEAKRINPVLPLDATAWSAPGWVGSWWSQDMADFYVTWLQDLKVVYGLELDAIGCHNEKGKDYDFAKLFRKTLNERGFSNVRLHGFDNWGRRKLNFLPDMLTDPELCDALDIISAHTFSEIPISDENKAIVETLGKPLWNTEDHIYKDGFDALISIVECFNENYIVNGATKVINYYDIAGVYPMQPHSVYPATVIANEPWSGHYEVREALWGYAHYGQFTRIGWQYVDDGCRTLDGGGTMVTLKDPATGDFSVIIETKGAQSSQTIKIRTGKGFSKAPVCVWYSDEKQQFVQLADIKQNSGGFTICLEPDAVYSLSTTRGQQKGSFDHVPDSKAFPMPYAEDFEGYANPAEWGWLPHYTADILGAFELAERPDRDGLCIRQVVGEPTLSWAPKWHHYTILGDIDWKDYEVSADVWLNPGDEAGVMGRVYNVGIGYGVWVKGYYMKIDEDGVCKLIKSCGKVNKKELIGDAEQQAMIKARKDFEEGGEFVVDSTKVAGVRPCSWHKLKLRFEGDVITGYVDGIQVVRTVSDQYGNGMAGLIAPMLGDRNIATPYFDNLSITPLGRTKANGSSTASGVQPLYPQSGISYAGKDGHRVGEVPSEDGLFPFVISYDLSKGVTDCTPLIDAPAGKYGFTRIEGQHFVNDAGRIRFNGMNIVGGANFPTHEQAERMAKRMAHLGFNIARLHYFDLAEYRFRAIREKGILEDDGTFLTFNPEQQDKFDYLVWQLKKHGIYINVNLLVGRRFKDRNGFDKELQKKEIDYARALFSHVNPYTGLTLADDPAVAMVELNNENAVVTSILRWKKNLRTGDNTPDWPTYEELAASSEERKLEMLTVFESADRDHWNRQKDVLVNELGVRVPITGSQVNYSTPWASRQMDYFDMHAYWCHPENSADQDNWYIENLPMVNETDGAKLTEIATYRPVDRPFTVSEYNHPFPNLYGAEGQPMLHAYGAFQGWDGLIGHSYHNLSDVEPDHLAYNFTYAARTDALAHSISCATMFLRGDVLESQNQYVENLTRDVYEKDWVENLRFWISEKLEMASDNTFLLPQRLVHRVATDFYAQENKSFPEEELGKTVFSDGGQIEWNHDIPDRSMFIVRTGNTKVFSGFPAGRTVDWGDNISFEVGPTKLGWATVSLVSKKANGFNKQSSSLLVATGYTKQQGQKFTIEPEAGNPGKPSTAIHSRHEDWGTGPMLTEGIPLTLHLPSNARQTHCWALDESGKRREQVPVIKAADGTSILKIGPEYKTVWYEIEVK